MNRRRFLTATAAGALLPLISASAHEERLVENPLSEIYEMLPDQPDENGYSFPVTTGTVGSLQRTVWPENPEMYWDPVGEDFRTIFDFHPAAMMLSASQEGAELWSMNLEMYNRDSTRSELESNGWQAADADFHILQYVGSEDDRSALAASLNLLGTRMQKGEWDWVAVPDDVTVVMGNDGDRVTTIADRVLNNSPGSSMGDWVDTIQRIVRNDSYLISFLPPERLPMEGVNISFISRSWTGDTPIIHSIGMQMDTPEEAEQMVDAVQSRMESETSRATEAVYSDFLEIQTIWRDGESVRFDFITNTDEWDVFDALNASDLRMLPLIDNAN